MNFQSFYVEFKPQDLNCQRMTDDYLLEMFLYLTKKGRLLSTETTLTKSYQEKLELSIVGTRTCQSIMDNYRALLKKNKHKPKTLRRLFQAFLTELNDISSCVPSVSSTFWFKYAKSRNLNIDECETRMYDLFSMCIDNFSFKIK